MFEELNPVEKKLVSDVIFWAIGKDTINVGSIISEFSVSERVASAIASSLETLGILTRVADEHAKESLIAPSPNTQLVAPWYVIVSEIGDINDNIISFLEENGHDRASIIVALKGLPLDKKTPTSNILNDSTYQWFSTDDPDFPTLGNPVVIRLMDPNKIFMETRTEVVYAEDIKIGEWDGNKWIITGPHPKYDFSPLSCKEKINDGVQVTHWARTTDEMLKGWKTRLEPINKYKHLELNVDDDNEADVYHALIVAAAWMMRSANEYSKDDPIRIKLVKAYQVMCDLQSAIDYSIISNMEEGSTDALDN